MKRLMGLLACTVLMIVLLLPVGVQAQPNVCGFWGEVTLNGSAVPNGTVVKAWIDSVVVRSELTTNSQYLIAVGGNYPGKVVTFTVGDGQYMATQTAIWEAGESINLNLNASSSPSSPPQIELSPTAGILTTITGEGFRQGSVAIMWEGSLIHSTYPNPVPVDASGKFSAIIVPPTNDPGKYNITARSDPAGITASATFTLNMDALKGDTGAQGIEGPVGEAGPLGPIGPAGEKGEKGGAGGLIIAIIALVVALAVAAMWFADRRSSRRRNRTV